MLVLILTLAARDAALQQRTALCTLHYPCLRSPHVHGSGSTCSHLPSACPAATAVLLARVLPQHDRTATALLLRVTAEAAGPKGVYQLPIFMYCYGPAGGKQAVASRLAAVGLYLTDGPAQGAVLLSLVSLSFPFSAHELRHRQMSCCAACRKADHSVALRLSFDGADSDMLWVLHTCTTRGWRLHKSSNAWRAFWNALVFALCCAPITGAIT